MKYDPLLVKFYELWLKRVYDPPPHLCPFQTEAKSPITTGFQLLAVGFHEEERTKKGNIKTNVGGEMPQAQSWREADERMAHFQLINLNESVIACPYMHVFWIIFNPNREGVMSLKFISQTSELAQKSRLKKHREAGNLRPPYVPVLRKLWGLSCSRIWGEHATFILDENVIKTALFVFTLLCLQHECAKKPQFKNMPRILLLSSKQRLSNKKCPSPNQQRYASFGGHFRLTNWHNSCFGGQ